MEPLQSGSAGKGFSYPDTSSVSVCNRKLCSLETISGQYRYFDPGHPPLALLAQGEGMPSLIRVIFGHPGGALGETTAFLVILGGLYLVRKGHISWHIPISIVATVFVIGLVTIPTLGWQGGPLYHVLTGGVLLGAFFMATDWVTSPITDKGKLFSVSASVCS